MLTRAVRWLTGPVKGGGKGKEGKVGEKKGDRKGEKEGEKEGEGVGAGPEGEGEEEEEAAGSEENSVVLLCLAGLVCTSTLESLAPSFPSYLALSLLPATIFRALLTSSSRSLFLGSVPHRHLGKVLGVFGAATSAIGVLSPLYGSQLFSLVNLVDLQAWTGTGTGAGEGVSVSPMSAAKRLRGAVTAAHYLWVLLLAGLCSLRQKLGSRQAQKQKQE
ncbi:hypothetical protein B484DRAFT_119694 [Ochromonadaceae sp. CCMP2298]|nr:hypothetical protein B484DRAFT_119694 [Ochromonadaceae sp. CCMP2298]